MLKAMMLGWPLAPLALPELQLKFAKFPPDDFVNEMALVNGPMVLEVTVTMLVPPVPAMTFRPLLAASLIAVARCVASAVLSDEIEKCVASS